MKYKKGGENITTTTTGGVGCFAFLKRKKIVKSNFEGK